MGKRFLFISLVLITVLAGSYAVYHMLGYKFFDILSKVIYIICVVFFTGISLLYFLGKKMAPLFFKVLLMVCLSASLFFPFFRNSLYKRENQINRIKAKEMVGALEKFYTDQSKYPFQISDLKPKYIHFEPSYRVFLGSRRFDYKYFANYYLLSYKSQMGIVNIYDSRTKFWSSDD